MSAAAFDLRRSTRAIVGVTTLATVAACAASRPEQALSVATADGRQVSMDSATITYTVGAVRVIQRANYANDVVSANLYLLGGTRQLTAATQGIESLLLHASQYGTRAYPGGASRTAWARTGSILVIDTESDWTMFGFRGVRQEFDSSWSVFADRLTHPQFGAEGVTLARAKMLSRLRTRIEHPDGYVSLLADSVAFTGHPYGLQTEGTEASLTTLDSTALARYAAEQMVGTRLLLVVVGNIDRARLEAAVQRTLATLPAGTYAWSLPAPRVHTGSGVALLPRDVSTNYIMGTFQGPPASSPDVPAFRMATAWLSSRVNHAVREERGLSYAAMAMMVDRGVVTGGLYVSTNSPGTVLPLIKAQIDSIRNVSYGMYSLRGFTDQFIMDYYAENMTSAAQADFLARAQLLRGDYKRAAHAMDDLRGVGMSEMRGMVVKYFKDIQFVYLGDTTRVLRKMFTDF